MTTATALTQSFRSGIQRALRSDLVASLNHSQTAAARGCAAYHYGSLRFISRPGEAMAGALQDAMVEAGFGPDCRVHPMTWTILRETRMPAVVLEPGFSSNPDDLARLSDPLMQDRLSRHLVRGVRRFLDRYGDA